MPACFSGLPLEVKRIVWSYVDYECPSDQRKSYSLVPYACVSLEWQLAFERATFRKVTVKSNQLSSLKKYVVGHRMGFLHVLRFIIIIPKLLHNNPVERRRRNRAFTKSIKGLWTLLKLIEGLSSPAGVQFGVISFSPFAPRSI